MTVRSRSCSRVLRGQKTISERLAERDILRTGVHYQEKVKKLHAEYKQIRDHNKVSCRNRKTIRLLSVPQLDAVLGHGPSTELRVIRTLTINCCDSNNCRRARNLRFRAAHFLLANLRAHSALTLSAHTQRAHSARLRLMIHSKLSTTMSSVAIFTTMNKLLRAFTRTRVSTHWNCWKSRAPWIRVLNFADPRNIRVNSRSRVDPRSTHVSVLV